MPECPKCKSKNILPYISLNPKKPNSIFMCQDCSFMIEENEEEKEEE